MRAVLLALLVLALATVARADFTTEQPANYAKTHERTQEFSTPEYQALQAQVARDDGARLDAELAKDPERDPSANLCEKPISACQGDARLYGWQQAHRGLSVPVHYTAADGATISGHVWATRRGPRHRPGIIIAGGSVAAPERLYWWAATTLAKAGYVVMTFDVQGQGESDTYGEGDDRNTHVPAEPEEADRTTSSWMDGLRGAIDFFLSSPKRPYRPLESPVTRLSHAAKQRRRVKARLANAFNPLWQRLDRHTKIGLAGHSTGAQTTEQLSRDPRVGAAVLWDDVDTDENDPSQVRPNTLGGKPKVPVLTFGADYGIPATPYATRPDPNGRTTVSTAYSKAGLDTMAVNVRGGTHLEWAYLPLDAVSATLRGMDEGAWYTRAWFDRYLRHRKDADARLLTDRWRHDRLEAAVDPGGDGNLFSTYYRSRVDIRLANGRRARCEDLRAGCEGLPKPDGGRPDYSYVRQALARERP